MEIQTLDVQGFAPALKGMRNPLNSWDKSDSEIDEYGIHIGEADKALSLRLQKAGPEHCKHLRMIVVWVDITAPRYWWTQMVTYKIGVESVSQSTMHTIMKRPFNMNDFEFSCFSGYKYEPEQFQPEVDENTEIWKNYEGYEISNQGRIKNKKGVEIKGCLHDDGYRFVWFNGKVVPLHRLVAKVFCDGYSEDKVVNHIDANKQNNFASNLEWVTIKENVAHARENDLQPKPTKFYAGKLSEEDRNKIKELFAQGYTKRNIASMFGVSHTCICDFLNGKSKYIKEIPNDYEEIARPIVNNLNQLREDWLTSEDLEEKRIIWETIISILPQSYFQKRTVMMSYAALRNIVRQRKGHKLGEWKQFIDWAKTLPESWMIFDE